MKHLLLVFIVFGLSACGWSQLNSEVIGQIKKVANVRPIFCDDYVEIDISMGVMRDGVGSMSSEDVWMYVADKELIETLKKANETGKLVKIKFDEKRWRWCVRHEMITSVEIVN